MAGCTKNKELPAVETKPKVQIKYNFAIMQFLRSPCTNNKYQLKTRFYRFMEFTIGCHRMLFIFCNTHNK